MLDRSDNIDFHCFLEGDQSILELGCLARGQSTKSAARHSIMNSLKLKPGSSSSDSNSTLLKGSVSAMDMEARAAKWSE